MFIHRNIQLGIILKFAWKMQLASFALSSIVYIVYTWFNFKMLSIPFLPVATIGTAVAFYVGFKNNSAYDRLWEGRKIWGSITNATRMWGSMVMNVVGSRQTIAPEVKQKLIYRHIAWLNMLRLQLRKTPVFASKEYRNSAQVKIIEQLFGPVNFEAESKQIIQKFVPDEVGVLASPNPASTLLKNQNADLIKLKNEGYLDQFEHSDTNKLVLEFYHYQGAAERIKTFPFPRQYANFSFLFVYIFVFLLPFALIGEFNKMSDSITWLVIPFTMLIAWVFNVMEQVGDASENPFDNTINDVPMNTICRNLEIELRDFLQEKDLPEKIKDVNGIYM